MGFCRGGQKFCGGFGGVLVGAGRGSWGLINLSGVWCVFTPDVEFWALGFVWTNAGVNTGANGYGLAVCVVGDDLRQGWRVGDLRRQARRDVTGGLGMNVLMYTSVLTTGTTCTGCPASGRLLAIARRAKGVGKAVVSSGAKRPIVKTDIGMGNAGLTTMASLGNRFRLGARTGTALRVSCIKFGRARIGTDGNVGVSLRRSARSLRRIIMIKCNARGGRDLANTVTGVGKRGLGSVASTAIRGVLGNGISNICMTPNSNHPNSAKTVVVHKRASVGNTATPL